MASTAYEAITADPGGDPATDLGVVNAAIASLNASLSGGATRGLLYLQGVFNLETTPSTIDPRISVVKRGGGDGFRLGASAQLNIGSNASIISGYTNYALDPCSSASYYVDVADTLYGTLAAGDWIWLRSNDVISGVNYDLPVAQYPGELHNVDGYDSPSGGKFRVYLREPIIDSMSTTAYCVHLPQMSAGEGSEYDFCLYTNSATRTTGDRTAVDWYASTNARVHVLADTVCPGALRFIGFANSKAEVSITRAWSTSYNIVAGYACAGSTIDGRVKCGGAASTRHAFTTGGAQPGGNITYGTPHHNTILGYYSGCRVPVLDCHAAGYEICFNGCVVEAIRDKTTGSVVAIDSRARNTIVKNCVLHGRIGPGSGDDSYGVQFKAAGCRVENSTFNGFSIATQVHNSGFDNCAFIGNRFENIKRACVRIDAGGDHWIDGNVFGPNTAYSSSNYGWIEFAGSGVSDGDGTKIFGNRGVKTNALCRSISLGTYTDYDTLYVSGNEFYGFGPGSMGLTGSGSIANLAAKWRWRNHIDAETLTAATYDTDADFVADITADITSQTDSDSITPAVVGAYFAAAVARSNR